MKKMFRINTQILLLLTLLSCKNRVGEVKVPYYNTPDFTPNWTEKADKPHIIAPFSFKNQNGETVTNAHFKDKIYVANFFFTSCPSICPKMTDNMQKVAASFAKEDDVLLISHSVMPWVDSVPRLREYAALRNIKAEKWHLVTGETGDIYNTARKSYFAEEAIGYQRDSSEFLHTEHLILVDKKQRIRGIYNGTLDLDAQRLIEDIGYLRKE
jgi:protein SCO1